jgi:hypothetical protein
MVGRKKRGKRTTGKAGFPVPRAAVGKWKKGGENPAGTRHPALPVLWTGGPGVMEDTTPVGVTSQKRWRQETWVI